MQPSSEQDTTSLNGQEYFQTFTQVLESEAQAILDVRQRISADDITALMKIFKLLSTTGGSLVVSGVGKSGVIAQKISSTFCSLGLPSYFLHPTEALHGDLGRVTKNDAVILISKSGTTEELLKLIPYLPVDPQLIIGLIGQVPSPLSQKCAVVLDCFVQKEACLNNQAPTTSTTVTLAIGDAMAVIYEKLVGLSKEKFAMSHPGGILGKSLRLKVKDLMIHAAECPMLSLEATFQDVILKMTERPLGICIFTEHKSEDAAKNKLQGIIVEGDIRRIVGKGALADLKTPMRPFINLNPISISAEALAFEALQVMENRQRPISVLPVLEGETFVGVVRLHDLLKEGLFLRK